MHKPLLIIGSIPTTVGIIGMAWGFQPSSGTLNLTIPEGSGFYAYAKISFWMNAHISGSFEVTGTGTVHFYVLDSAQYDDYAWSGDPIAYLYTSFSASGAFSVDIPDNSPFYLIAHHGEGYNGFEQGVKVTYKISGLDLKYFIGGVVVLVAGIVISLFGQWMKAKARKATPLPVPPPLTQVTMFDNKR